MLDNRIKPLIDPTLSAIGATLAGMGITANGVTIAGALIGLLAAAAISFEAYILGLVLLLVSRICDGLDGAVARHAGASDFGGYLDIVLDFLFYGAIPFAFIIANPEANAIAGAFLLLSFYFNGASFLASAIMAEKRSLDMDRGQKSFLFTTGLAEATETIAVFVLICLFPQWFEIIAYVFGAICFYTALSRIIATRAMLAD